MKRGILIGALMMATLWGLVAGCTGPDVVTKTKTEVVTYTDVETQTITKEVEKPITQECEWYTQAVDDLTSALEVLSNSKAQMAEATRIFGASVKTGDTSQAVEVERQMRLAQTGMDNAWLDIGDAESDLDRYDGACE
jgi:hypothetical protein